MVNISLYVDIINAGALDALIRIEEKETNMTPINTINLGLNLFKLSPTFIEY
jgi:hypothetical protein